MAGATWNSWHLGARSVYTTQPFNSGEENSPAAPAGNRIRDLPITSLPLSYTAPQWYTCSNIKLNVCLKGTCSNHWKGRLLQLLWRNLFCLLLLLLFVWILIALSLSIPFPGTVVKIGELFRINDRVVLRFLPFVVLPSFLSFFLSFSLFSVFCCRFVSTRKGVN